MTREGTVKTVWCRLFTFFELAFVGAISCQDQDWTISWHYGATPAVEDIAGWSGDDGYDEFKDSGSCSWYRYRYQEGCVAN